MPLTADSPKWVRAPSNCSSQPHQSISFQEATDSYVQACPFAPVLQSGSGLLFPHGSISIPVSFGMPENYRTESIIFDIAEVNHPFNAILDQLALYEFMAMAHSRYMVLKVVTQRYH
jgi:hypothetical protein